MNKWRIFGFTVITWLIFSVLAKGYMIAMQQRIPEYSLIDGQAVVWSWMSLLLGIFMAIKLRKWLEIIWGPIVFIVCLFPFGFAVGIAYFAWCYTKLERVRVNTRSVGDTTNQFLADASFLISAIRSNDVNHQPCYQFAHENEGATWVVPSLAWFEYQAAQSRLQREGNGAYREVYWPNVQVLDITYDLVRDSAMQNLAETFDKLHGADLVYACIAKTRNLSLVTTDADFEKYNHEITVLNPLQIYKNVHD